MWYGHQNVGFNTDLMLYSPAMQTHSLWGLALVKTPNATISRWGYQHVGIGKASRTQLEPPRTQREASWTQREPNTSRWNIGHVGSLVLGLALAMSISCCFVSISFALGSQWKAISSRIQALKFCIFTMMLV